MAKFALSLVASIGAFSFSAAAHGRPGHEAWKQAKVDIAEEALQQKKNESKMAAVNKVVTFLEGLRSKVAAEAEIEEQAYNKFHRFCEESISDKTKAINKRTNEQSALSALIGTYESEKRALEGDLELSEERLREAQENMRLSTESRADSLKVYEKSSADLRGAIEALTGAIDSLKTSKGASLAQLQTIDKQVKTATALASALGVQDAPEVRMEDYKFHSEEIIKVLEGLLTDFRAERDAVDKAEVESVALHEKNIQKGTDDAKRVKGEIAAETKGIAEKKALIGQATSELAQVSAMLADDKQYQNEQVIMCDDKAKTYEQRSSVRESEIDALTSALAVITTAVSEKTTAKTLRLAQQHMTIISARRIAQNPGLMTMIEADAEAADQLSFFQLAQDTAVAVRGDGRDAALKALKLRSEALNSTTLMAFVARLSADPFAKVKGLIQDLIERLLDEASRHSTQKNWCDKSTSDATQRRGYAAQEAEAANAELMSREATDETLEMDIATLTTELQALADKQAQETDMRSAESAENSRIVTEAREGMEAVELAADILAKWYKVAAKGTVALLSVHRGPEDDAPDAGFANGEAYKGSQSESGGILALMEVIGSDFKRTIAETEKAENEAKQDHLAFMTESGKSVAEKTAAKGQLTSQNMDNSQALEAAKEKLKSQTDLMVAATQELIQLKATCVDTGMSYNERITRRQDEIQALKQADCILDNYAKFGPGATAEEC